jgi:hypothetical protein
MRIIFIASVALALLSGTDPAWTGNLLISVDKARQEMTVTVDGVQKYTWPISTGVKGYPTPSGSFQPLRMERDHVSEEWDDAPMPFSIFFTPDGHAIHGSPHVKRLGKRASHGCVRLAPANAARLYEIVQRKGMRNTRIVINRRFEEKGQGRLAGAAPSAVHEEARAKGVRGRSSKIDNINSTSGGRSSTKRRKWDMALLNLPWLAIRSPPQALLARSDFAAPAVIASAPKPLP